MMCPNPISIPHPHGTRASVRLTVPCGKCPVCLTNRRIDWIIRLKEEAKMHIHSLFVTLTYADENLHYNENQIPSVEKAALSAFMKRLRRRCNFPIRFYGIGEYGGKFHRPHYHIILFGISPDYHEIIQAVWPFGSVHVGTVEIKSISYVAKYHVNKTKFPPGANPPFALMSRRPGIGANYVKKMYKWHRTGTHTAFYPDFERKLRLPRYYKEKLYTPDERNEMSEEFQSKDKMNTEEAINAYLKRFPDGNYFKYRNDLNKEIRRKFKEKYR